MHKERHRDLLRPSAHSIDVARNSKAYMHVKQVEAVPRTGVNRCYVKIKVADMCNRWLRDALNILIHRVAH